MNHILSYKLFEEARIADFLNPENIKNIKDLKLPDNEENEGVPLTTWVGISGEMEGTNKFNIKYNKIIKLSYNDTEEHSIRGDKRMLLRTNMFTHDFNNFIKKAFSVIYPEYFFNGVSNFYDFEHKDLPLRYKKNYILVVKDKKFEKDYCIPYTISKRYNYLTNEYDFNIYIITILPTFDIERTYKLFYLTVSEMGDVILNKADKNFEYWFKSIPVDIKEYITKKEEEEKGISEEIKKRKIYNEEPIKLNKSTIEKPLLLFEKPKMNKNNS